jgi:hypothetical protein
VGGFDIVAGDCRVSHLSKIIANNPKVPQRDDVNDSMKEFWKILDIFQKNPKVPQKFDVTGTRRQKIAVPKPSFRSAILFIPPCFHRGATMTDPCL